jgi:hypothetical protein
VDRGPLTIIMTKPATCNLQNKTKDRGNTLRTTLPLPK